MLNSAPEISIVIISWKMKDLLNNFLRSIYKYTTGVSFEIILIDNNSEDGTTELIRNNYPDIRLITNDSNRGVAPARNQGIKSAAGRYVLILDADMELSDNSILQLYNFMEDTPDCGMSGCKLVDSQGNLQYSCKRFPTLGAFIFRRLENFKFIRESKTLKYHTMQDWDHCSIRDVDYLIGACQFIRKEVIDEVGSYDEHIFYGPEDIDMCLRIRRKGWKIFYYPFTSIFHHEQRITKKNLFSSLSLKHLKGILYLYKKYKGKIKP
jgi:GT2 family glycosyltransferase